jgi:hypothetical protein
MHNNETQKQNELVWDNVDDANAIHNNKCMMRHNVQNIQARNEYYFFDGYIQNDAVKHVANNRYIVA